MDVSAYISRKIRFKGRYVIISIAISFLVMILAVAISSGFRTEIRNGVSSIAGDICLRPANMTGLNEGTYMEKEPSYLDMLKKLPAVEEVIPAVYRAGIVKAGSDIHGVMLKGLPSSDSLKMEASIPSALSTLIGLQQGDFMTVYFVGETVKVRKFKVASIYDSLLDSDDNIIVYTDLRILQRLNGWEEDRVSALEINLKKKFKNERDMKEAENETGFIAGTYSKDEEVSVVSESAASRYSQLFDWLSLIDFNVLFIIILMTIVAGFNMISGLLILLFENISTIGLLKALGMNDRSISKIFIYASSRIVLKGMLIGNVIALTFCILQSHTHFLGLDPANYFISFVPVDFNIPMIFLADVAAYFIIMLLLLIPCHFISRVDPASTVRVR